MNTENPGHIDYVAVLADLRNKRDALDRAIRAIEPFAGVVTAGHPVTTVPTDGTSIAVEGDLLGMSIADATKRVLASRRKPLSNQDLVQALRNGGLHFTSDNPTNIVGSVLNRRQKEVGDIVRVERAWGLREWYGNRNFNKSSTKGPSETEAKSDPSVSEPPSPPDGDDPQE